MFGRRALLANVKKKYRRLGASGGLPAPLPYPAQLFAGGNTGFWIDIDDSPLFEDIAATIPASANGPVAQINDLSGGGNHLIVGANADRATRRDYGSTGKWLEFDGNHFYRHNSMVLDRRNFTLLLVMTGRAGTTYLFASPQAAPLNMALQYLSTGTEQSAQIRSFTTAQQDSGLYANQNPANVMLTRWNAANRRYMQGRQTINLAAAAAGSGAGFYFGRWNDSVATGKLVGLNLKAAVGIQRALLDAEMEALYDWAAQKYKGSISRTENCALFRDGDSISQGVGAFVTTAGTYTATGGLGVAGNMRGEPQMNSVSQVGRSYNSCPVLINYGTGGGFMNGNAGGMSSAGNFTNINAELGRLVAAGYTNIAAVLAGGTNDITTNNETSANLIAFATAWANNIQTNFPTAKRLVHTILPRAAMNGAQNTTRVAYNAWARGVAVSSSIFNACVDHAADSRLTNPNDLSAYRDGTHTTALGSSYIAQNERAVLDAVGFPAA